MLKYRVISGCVIGAGLILSTLYLPPVAIWLSIILWSALAQFEFYAIINRAEIPVFRVVGLLCGTALISATYWTIGPSLDEMAGAYKWEQCVLLSSLIAVFVRLFPQKDNKRPLSTVACTLLGIWYVPFLLNFITRLAFEWEGSDRALVGPTGRILLLYLLVVVKTMDMGAYFVGRLMGRHKLWRRISPAKTWEGLVGGVLASVAASCAFQAINSGSFGVLDFNWFHAVCLGIVLALTGVAGDLFESLVKRAAGKKDSSSTIPGMGGVLDVLDSLLFGAPVMYLYVKLFVA